MTAYLISLVRHLVGYLILLPLIIVATMIQALIVVPLTGNRKTVPHLIYRLAAFIFAIRFQMNPDSAKLSGEPTMFVANHLSRADFMVLPLFPDAAVMMNAAFFRMPLIGPIVHLFASSAGIVGTLQSQDQKGHDLERFSKALNSGRSIFLFPEGVQTDARRVLRYSKGSAELFYDPTYSAMNQSLSTTQVQPVVLRVKKVAGKDVLNHPEKWHSFALALERTNIFKGMFRSSLVRSVDIDVLVLPPLNPSDYPDAASLMGEAQRRTQEIVAPNQTKTMTRAQWRIRLDAKDFSL